MNIFKLSHAFLAVIMIASCNKMITTETLEGVGYITVTSQIGSQTKAGYETKNLPSEFVMDIDQNGTDHDYALLKMSRNGSSNTYIANKNDIAWASTDRRNVSVKAMTMPAGVTEINSDGIVNINLLSDQTTLENFNKNDILGAKKADNGGITIKGDNINISFQHLMSKLHIVYEATDNSVVVEAIALTNVAVEGAYSYADMEYIQNNNPEKGDIAMFLNAGTQYGVFAAEAIFCPYTPSSSSRPTLNVKISGVDNPISSAITLPSNFSFESGKRYVMKVNVSKNSVSQVSLTSVNEWVKNVPGGKILWIGTSIPAGGGTAYSYPQMVSNATGLEVINNAVGGSLVLKNPYRRSQMQNYTKEYWDQYTAGQYSPCHLTYGALVQDFAEIESYRSLLSSVKSTDGSSVDEAWVTKHINKLKELSHESLILPYIDGTIANCSTIVIDHGFNDLGAIIKEASGFHGWDNPEYGGDPTAMYADNYFEALLNKGNLVNAGEVNYEHYKLHLKNLLWPNAYCTEEESYLLAMEHIINKCREKNPDINIIIGNYFTENNNWIHHYHNKTADEHKGHSFARTLCYYNKAVAMIFNCRGIVNVQDSFKYLTNEDLWSNEYDPTYGAKFDATKFCPDGVHPSSDNTGESNKAIADVYLRELRDIFGSSTKTKSTDNSSSLGWEDVEIF